MSLMLTLHLPLLPVVQEAVPLAPLLQVPLTVALATGLWFASCTVMVTLAVHPPFWLVLNRSKSPMCMVVDVGVGVRVDVGVRVRVDVGVGVRVGVDNGVFVAGDTDVGVAVGAGRVGTLFAGPM